MKMYIPEIGDRIVLTQDWSLTLYDEYRNTELMKSKGLKPSNRWTRDPKSYPVTIQKGVELKIDRVYIRKNTWGQDAGKFSSITFIIPNSPKNKSVRFWAKLKDVNNIEFKVLETDPNREKTSNVSIRWEWRHISMGTIPMTSGYDGFIGKTKRFEIVFKERKKIPYQEPAYIRDPATLLLTWIPDPSGKTTTRYVHRDYYELRDNGKVVGTYAGEEGCKSKARLILKKELNQKEQ